MSLRQTGTTTVEFAIVGLLAMIVLFGCLEFGRLLYTMNSLAEGTRRGARVAAVCPIDHPAIARVATFHAPDGGETGVGIAGLTEANIDVAYLDAADNETTDYSEIQFVRVAVSDFRFAFNVPLVGGEITMPDFATTLPAESLGYVPDLDSRQCFGS